MFFTKHCSIQEQCFSFVLSNKINLRNLKKMAIKHVAFKGWYLCILRLQRYIVGLEVFWQLAVANEFTLPARTYVSLIYTTLD